MAIGGWDGIEEFVHVARAASFTAGARTMQVSVTHMSRTIARLEARLGTQLLNRTTRSVHLTETGRQFLDHCLRMIDEREEALASITANAEPLGTLRITCSYAIGEMFIAPLLRSFAEQYPGLAINLELNNDIIDIAARGFDLAVRTGHLEDSRLIATRIASRKLVTVASRDYLSIHGEPASIADLANHSCLVGSSAIWRFRRNQIFRPVGRWSCNSGRTVIEACLAGMGICQLPAFYIADHFAAGRLKRVLPGENPDDEPIWAVYPTKRHLSPKVSQFVELLQFNLQESLRLRR